MTAVALEHLVKKETGKLYEMVSEDLADLCLEFLYQEPGTCGQLIAEVSKETGCDSEWLFNAFYED